MISATDLMKRIGAGGRLVPFFKCVCVYFAASAWSAEGEGGAAPSALAVAAKCAPVLCLLIVVALHHGPNFHPEGRYARRIGAGLAMSALGDALLVWPQHFVAGMAAFALAHLAYLAAFGAGTSAPAVGAALLAAVAAFLQLVAPPPPLRLLVPLYALLLAGSTWRALAAACSPSSPRSPRSPRRPRSPRSPAALAAAAGAVLFLISDAILGYSLFGAPVRYGQVLVMSTYYLGQLGIALSALEPIAPPQP